MGSMNADDIIELIVKIADPVRLRILLLLAREGEKNASFLLGSFPITQPTLSHHLNTLLASGAINARKDGRSVYYSINISSMSEIRKFIDMIINKKTEAPSRKQASAGYMEEYKIPSLKKNSAVPIPKAVAVAPNIEELKKKKKKKKDKDKDKGKKDKTSKKTKKKK